MRLIKFKILFNWIESFKDCIICKLLLKFLNDFLFVDFNYFLKFKWSFYSFNSIAIYTFIFIFRFRLITFFFYLCKINRLRSIFHNLFFTYQIFLFGCWYSIGLPLTSSRWSVIFYFFSPGLYIFKKLSSAFNLSIF